MIKSWISAPDPGSSGQPPSLQNVTPFPTVINLPNMKATSRRSSRRQLPHPWMVPTRLFVTIFIICLQQCDTMSMFYDIILRFSSPFSRVSSLCYLCHLYLVSLLSCFFSSLLIYFVLLLLDAQVSVSRRLSSAPRSLLTNLQYA